MEKELSPPQYTPAKPQYTPVQTQYVPVQPPPQFVGNYYNYGSEPMKVTCLNCRREVVTRTVESVNAICCFVFGCCALCCCQNVEHFCPQCNISLGMYKPA